MKALEAIDMLRSIQPEEVASFKIHPEATYTDDYSDAVELIQAEQLVWEFLQAITVQNSYQPQHDRALAQWGVQICTDSTTIRIGYYIPALTSETVVGNFRLLGSYGYFQSQPLLGWYQKYGHYWQVGDYQKVQYGRVMSVLKPIAPKDVRAFNLIPGDPEIPEKQEIIEFVQNRELVAEFFQALGDMHFAAPMYKESTAQWTVQIRSGTTAINIECSIPAENPTTVIGLVDSHEGYTYFQSQNLFQWYQQYSHRWLK